MNTASTPGGNRPSFSDTPFVGRGRELAELCAGLERMLMGDGQVMLLSGEPGIGKTRTAQVFAARAEERGARILWGRCYEWEGAPAYWPWVEVIRRSIRDMSEERVLAILGSGGADLAQIVPELQQRLPALAEAPSAEPEQARFRLFDSVYNLMTSIATEQPLVIVLDDLHWADKPSLLLFHFLAQRVHESRLLLLGTHRNVGLGRQHPLTPVLAELAREHHSARIMLPGLACADVAAFVRFIAGHEPPTNLVEAVYAETEGNPFFVTEIVRLLAVDGQLASIDWDASTRIRVPESVREVIGRRLDQLSADCNRVLSIAAVVGREFSFRLLERIDSGSRGDVLDILDEAVRAGLLEKSASVTSYRFSHALIQETMYEELATSERMRLHQAIGEAIEIMFSDNLEDHLADLARHFARAHPKANSHKAVDYAARAGDQAMRRIAWELAINHYQQALQDADHLERPDDQRRCEILLKLAKAQENSGDSYRSRATRRRVIDIARRSGAAEYLARAAIELMVGVGVDEVDHEAIALLEEAYAALPPDDSSVRVQLLSRLALTLYYVPGSLDRRDRLSAEAVEMARRIGDKHLLAFALLTRHRATWGPDNLEERVRDAGEGFQLSNPADVYHHEGGLFFLISLFFLIFDLLERGDIDAARQRIEEYRRIAEPSKLPRLIWTSMHNRAALALFTGQFREAEELITAALPIGQRVYTSSVALQMYTRQIAFLHRERGDLEGLQTLEPTVLDLVEQHPTIPHWQCVIAWLYAELGRLEDASRLMHRLSADDFTTFPRDVYWILNLALLSEVSVATNDDDAAMSLYRLLQSYADRNVTAGPNGICCGPVAYYLGLLARQLGRLDDAERHFRDALSRSDRMGALPWSARSASVYAAMLIERGGSDETTRVSALLGQALSITERIGMCGLSRDVRERLDRLEPSIPDSSSKQDSSIPYGLTERELDVLRLLVDGFSNREIAASLSISQRTVTTHVTSILNKLGVPTRTAAASVALRLGLV